MKIVNVRKDGTVEESMSNVTVPKEIVENVVKIIERKERKKNGGKVDL